MQWEIIIIVSGKHLSDLLEVIEKENVIEWSMKAVKGATVEAISAKTKRRFAKKSQLREIEPSGGSMSDKVGALILDADVKKLTRKTIGEYITKIGGNPSGLSYYIANLRQAKIIGEYNSAEGTYAVLDQK